MNKSEVAYLVAETYSQNEYGVQEKQETKRKIYVSVTSVNGQEWFEGGRSGLNPHCIFTRQEIERLAERLIEYKNKVYTIYRTYQRNIDEIDLYTELRKGNE